MFNNDEWYVINTYNGKENRVKALIMGMKFDDVQVCNLSRIISEKKGNVIKPKIKSVFPGYVFIKGNLDVLKYISILGFNDVLGFIKAGIIPVSVSEKHIIHLLNYGLECKENIIKESLVSIRAEGLHVINGPLKGMENNISKTMLRRNRVYVDLSIFGNQHTFSMPVMTLKREKGLL